MPGHHQTLTGKEGRNSNTLSPKRHGSGEWFRRDFWAPLPGSLAEAVGSGRRTFSIDRTNSRAKTDSPPIKLPVQPNLMVRVELMNGDEDRGFA